MRGLQAYFAMECRMKELTLQELTKELYGVEITISRGRTLYFATGVITGSTPSILGFARNLFVLWAELPHNINALRKSVELNEAAQIAQEDNDTALVNVIDDYDDSPTPVELQAQFDAMDAKGAKAKVKTCADCTYLHDTFMRNEQHMCNALVSPKVWTNSSDEACGEFIAKTSQSES